jgi:hypothetical protein
MAYDASMGRVVLFGGRYDGELNDTWTWDGTDWRQETPRTLPPAGEGMAAYDRSAANVVLFVAGQTWTWNGKDWSLQHPAASPQTRVLSRMVYDDVMGKVVLFAGKIVVVSRGVGSETVTNETWLWDGANWTLWGGNGSALGTSGSIGVGRSAPYRLYTHCGVLAASISGQIYYADPPLTDGAGNPPPGWGNPYDDGDMTLQTAMTADFHDSGGHAAHFTSTPRGQTPSIPVCS